MTNPTEAAITVDEPNWAPLGMVLCRTECEDYMYMGHVGEIELYKHRFTRRYLNIHQDGRRFYCHLDGSYFEISRSEALGHVRNLDRKERSSTMAKCVNKALLLGYAGKVPEIRSTAGGILAASFSLATSDRQQDRQGNWTDRTEWHNLVAYGRTAEIVRDYVNKGTQLFIQGKIQTRFWDDKEFGQKRNRTEIVVFDLTLIGRGHEKTNSPGRNTVVDSCEHASESGDHLEHDERYDNGDFKPEDIPF